MPAPQLLGSWFERQQNPPHRSQGETNTSEAP